MTILPHQSASPTASLGLALVISSNTPLVLLDSGLLVLAASGSFCRSFGLDPKSVPGCSLFDLGNGEWNKPQLRALLRATASGSAEIEAYEMDLIRPGEAPRCLQIHAHILENTGSDRPKLVMAVADITDERAAVRLKDDLVREKQVLFDELQHRVANSLQIIASVLMQSARKVQSEESRIHLTDAHNRVMSIATLQRQLAASKVGDVALRPYFTELCASIAASMIPDAEVISLDVTSDDTQTSAEVSVSLGLIVTELVINALKHAFPQGRIGKITVGYKAAKNLWTLSVNDDGVGMPVGDAIAKPGLGSGIVEALARQLEAVVTVTDAKPGTSVRVSNEVTASEIEPERELIAI